jgi:O-antigen ligase
VAQNAIHSKPFARASLLLAGLMWTLPFLQPYHRYPLTGFYTEWLAFALGLAAALMLVAREPWREAALPAVAFAPVGLAAVLGLQAVLGLVPYPEQALTAVLYLMWAALLIVLGHALRRAVGVATVANVLAWSLLAAGVLSAFVGLVQHFHVSTPLDFATARNLVRQAYGNLGQPNHHAAYLSFALASALYLYSRRSLHGWLASGCIALFLLVLTLTASRSPWIYLGAFTLLALALRRLRGGADSERLVVAALWLLPGLMLAQAVAALPFMASTESMTSTESLSSVSLDRILGYASGVDSRLQLWREAWSMFLDAPLLGAGFGQFAWHHFLAESGRSATATPGVFNHAHNIALQLMAETGLTGALLIIGGVVLWGFDLRGVRFDLEWWWLLTLSAVIGIHSLLEYPLWYAHFLGVAALLLGLGAQRSVSIRFSGVARAVAGLAVAAGWLNLLTVLPAYRDFEQLVFRPESVSAQHLDDEAFAKAIKDLYREPLLVPYLDLAVAHGAAVTEDRLPEKLALAERVVHFAPMAVVSYRYAQFLALDGQREAALRQFDRSLAAYPQRKDEAVREIEELARRHPGRFEPLLGAAAARGRALQRKAYE